MVEDVRMYKNLYLELVCDNLPKCLEKINSEILIQDSAPCHTAKYMK